jgi:hypothetical protein
MKIWYLMVFAMLSNACTQHKENAKEAAMEKRNPMTSARLVKASDLKTGKGYSTSVISSAQKFVIPVPAFADGGELLEYPEGHPKEGQPILDYQGKPIGKSGIVFFNFKDQSVQAASADGRSVIIINEVSFEQARNLDAEVMQLGKKLENLTLQETKKILDFARDQLHLGDMYNSTRSFIDQNMTPVEVEGIVSSKFYGLMKRDDRDINEAIYITGRFIFDGPAVTPQKFEDGGVIVVQRGQMRGVQTDVFERTYLLANGQVIRSAKTDIVSQSKD